MRADVSVVIPTIGRPSLRRAVESARRQDTRVEIIIVDDSCGGIIDLDLGDGLTILQTPGRVGAAAARNMGMATASGRFIAFLDDDDEWLPGHLRNALRTLVEQPESDIYASRGLVLDENGEGRVEPTVLVRERTLAEYFFERSTWHSRSRRILTPTIVLRESLRTHRMDSRRTVNEDTWWLLSAERDRGARLVQSRHVGVVVYGSRTRASARWGEELGDWLDRVEGLYPGAAAAEQLAMYGRPAVRTGRPDVLLEIARDVARRQAGWTWVPVIGMYAAAAAMVATIRRRRGTSRGSSGSVQS